MENMAQGNVSEIYHLRWPVVQDGTSAQRRAVLIGLYGVPSPPQPMPA